MVYGYASDCEEREEQHAEGEVRAHILQAGGPLAGSSASTERPAVTVAQGTANYPQALELRLTRHDEGSAAKYRSVLRTQGLQVSAF